MISHPQPTTLLQTALLSSKLQAASLSDRRPTSHGSDEVESDDESLVGVQTPLRSPSRQGGSLPSLSRSREPINLKTSSDPIKAFSSEIGIKIFGLLDLKSLARCQRVSRRWGQSQTINYVWYLHHRAYKFAQGEETLEKEKALILTNLPVGKWSRKESREDWRRAYRILIQTPADGDFVPYDPVDSPYASGTTTPTHRWGSPAPTAGPLGPLSSKVEAREAYKELKGRKSRTKRTMAGGGSKDRGGGFEGVEEDPYGDGRFDAPF
ncbi:hypothetical protein BDY24DRAFT_378033 [Mrakia frigida]|uniref:F-box protein n=1 Tax=Mrakia frigida TaxID=29902 RepID=UPI003FCC1210